METQRFSSSQVRVNAGNAHAPSKPSTSARCLVCLASILAKRTTACCYGTVCSPCQAKQLGYGTRLRVGLTSAEYTVAVQRIIILRTAAASASCIRGCSSSRAPFDLHMIFDCFTSKLKTLYLLLHSPKSTY